MAVVDVVLAAGQSNMTGVGDGSAATPTTALCLEWDGGPGLVQVADPTSCNTAPYKAQTGSMVPAFAATYTAWSGRTLVVVRAAAGGSSLLAANDPGIGGNGNWDTSGTRFPASVTRTLDAIDDIVALGHTIGRVFVIWSQGHRDAAAGNNLTAYQAATSALVTRWRTALSRPTLKVYMELLSSTSAASSTPPATTRWQTVRDAQTAACAATEGLEMGFTEGTEYYARGWLKTDNVHYGQNGLNYFGATLAEYVATDQGLAEPVDPPSPTPTVQVSHAARLLLAVPKVRPTVFTWPTAGTFAWTVPAGVASWTIECEGPGGRGGNGGSGLKGGAGGGGAYAKRTTIGPVPGETLTITTGAATGAHSQVVRDTGSVVLCKAVGGAAGGDGLPASDGAGGLASACVGDVTTSGQNGGVSGIDNGGNGAAPLGGAGGLGPGANAGTAPGGGGSGANAGLTQFGGAGSVGLVKITVVYAP